jgi:DNA polymerase-1
LARVEANGIRVDTAYVRKTQRRIAGEIKALEESQRKDPVYRAWRKRFGDKANLTSRPQLAEVLFNVLGHKSAGLTDKKRVRTDESALETVNLPFVRDFVRLEKLRKVLNTYLAGIMREVTPAGFIHPFFNLAGGNATDDGKGGAASFRSSSSSPNFQNMPNRLELLRRIVRRAFVPRGDDYQIVEFDFKGIEVTVAACYHKDPTMLKYVTDKSRCMHRDTAMELFGLTKDQVDPKTTRHIAKNKFVFPQFYGDWWASCAKNIWEELGRTKAVVAGTSTSIYDHLKAQGVTTRGEWDKETSPDDYKPRRNTLEYRVKQIEDKFWNERFPVYTAWKKRWYADYLRRGYFDYYTGFRVEGAYNRKQVINYAVQGSAFHCLLWCLVEMQRWLDRCGFKTRIIGQIHDSLIMDVHESELDVVIAKAQHIMSKQLLEHWDWIIAPLEVEFDVAPPGAPWLDKGLWLKDPKTGRWGMKASDN